MTLLKLKISNCALRSLSLSLSLIVFIQHVRVVFSQGLMLLLQNLPTQNWDDQQISLLLAEAYRLEYMFKDAPKHLQHVS